MRRERKTTLKERTRENEGETKKKIIFIWFSALLLPAGPHQKRVFVEVSVT